MSNPKFIVDAMLGNIARKLRFFGYDTKYSSNMNDKEVISLAKNENRVLLTKDKELANKATKEKIQNILFKSALEADQLVQIAKDLCMKEFLIDFNKTRCSLCNERIEKIGKENILEKIPEGIKHNKEFWICKKCNKVYWRGTHIEKLVQLTRILNEKI